MKIINDNLKKAGYFNIALIVIAIVLRLIIINTVPTIVKIDSIICIAALIFGLFYALSGYKKDGAKYYKAFISLYFVSSIVSLITSIIAPTSESINIYILFINIVVIVLLFILAFVKDVGISKSTNISLLILLVNIIKMFYTNKLTYQGGFANLILACILCVFVSAKYRDKESRGTK